MKFCSKNTCIFSFSKLINFYKNVDLYFIFIYYLSLFTMKIWKSLNSIKTFSNYIFRLLNNFLHINNFNCIDCNQCFSMRTIIKNCVKKYQNVHKKIQFYIYKRIIPMQKNCNYILLFVLRYIPIPVALIHH